MVKLIQLSKPVDRFKGFDVKADKVIQELDALGELYIDLGFRKEDVEDYDEKEKDELIEELQQHGQLVLCLVNHPLIRILSEVLERQAEEHQQPVKQFETPTGVWQHYKGTKYMMLEEVINCDTHLPSVLYQEMGKPDSIKYSLPIQDFYKLVEFNGERVKRFSKVEQ